MEYDDDDDGLSLSKVSVSTPKTASSVTVKFAYFLSEYFRVFQ